MSANQLGGPAGAEVEAAPQRGLNLARLLSITLLAALAAAAFLAQWWSHWKLVTLRTSDVYIFRGAGELIVTGQPLYAHEFWAGFWAYPPFGALVMAPLAPLPLAWLFPVWTGLSLVALLVVVAVSFSRYLSRVSPRAGRATAALGLLLLAVPVTPVSNAIGMGQLGILITAGCLVDVVVVSHHRPRWTGVLVGLAAAIKLTPGLFIVYFIARRQWRAAITSAATVAVCWSVAAVVLWDDSRRYFGEGVLIDTTAQIDFSGIQWMNQSIYGMTERLSTGTAQTLLYLSAAAIVGVLGVDQARRLGNRGAALPAATIVGLTSVLCSPLSWLHHAIWVVSALGAILGAGRSSRRIALTAFLWIVLVAPSAAVLRLPGASEWFVLAYVVLAVAVAIVGYADSTKISEPDVRPPATSHQLNSQPDRYYREAYDPVMYSGVIGVYSRIVHHLMERNLAQPHSRVILELGAASGQHARYVRGTYDVYYETDIAITHARSRRESTSGGVVERRHADAQDLSDFPDNSVDRIVATCLLVHLHSPEEALNEWRRVLRPGGLVTMYVAAEPGMLLRLLRRYFVVPKARRLGQDHLAIIYRDHRNHYPAMKTLVESVFARDTVRRLGFPIGFLGWNLRLFDIYYVTLSAHKEDGEMKRFQNAAAREMVVGD